MTFLPDPRPVTSFNDISVSELTPIVNIEFSYNIHTDIVETRLNNGAATIDANRLKLSTGAAANQSAQLFTKIPVKYYAGIGVIIRFAALFTTGVSNSTQIQGVGDSGDGLFFGYNGAAFGVLRRNGGNPEIRSIQVTVKSTTAENITITLDGDADATVAVTDATAGDVTTTANDIAAHDFSNLGRGWKAIANGDTVNFISYNSESRTGTYSLSGASTAVGVASQKLAGVAQTDTWIAQTAWSDDKFDGTGPSGITLIPTNGNVFQIQYQWLGYGQIRFFIENPSTGKLTLVHTIDYANTATIPSLNNPTLPLCSMVENTSNTSDIIVYSGSMGGFVEGKTPGPVVAHSAIVDITFASTTTVPVLTLHNNGVFQGKLNRVRIKIISISAEVESGKPAVIEIIREPTITGAVFSFHDANTSVMSEDTTATAITGGEVINAFSVPSAQERQRAEPIFIEPTEFLTIAGAQASIGANTVTKIVVNWIEDF
ncbi:hypothetical protein KAR91_47210 [Candidatus Pacearchaeota archaeon]|nr:hypothetical protein [Candidatus Pacearchaeota archaeon]